MSCDLTRFHILPIVWQWQWQVQAHRCQLHPPCIYVFFLLGENEHNKANTMVRFSYVYGWRTVTSNALVGVAFSYFVVISTLTLGITADSMAEVRAQFSWNQHTRKLQFEGYVFSQMQANDFQYHITLLYVPSSCLKYTGPILHIICWAI